jgi:tetratricopeptide (TPR) repeat protein
LFGREEILEEVDRLLAQAKEGHGQGLLLVGAGGAGKTHVLRAVVDRGIDREFRILSGRALPEELPPPFSLVRDLLGSMSEDDRGTPADAEGTFPLPVFLAPLGEAASARLRTPSALPQTTVAEDDLERILAPSGRTTIEGVRAGREKLLARVEEHFRNLARDRPLLIAIDDLHLADTSSLEFLWRFALDLPDTPAVVVATVGAGAEVPERTRTQLETLNRPPAFHSMSLRTLTVPEVTKFVRWILGDSAPDPQDILRWHAQTEGNPLFIEQLVRTVTGSGSTARRGLSTDGGDVTEILVSRVRALGEDDRRVLTYAAVLGKEFALSDLEAVAGLEVERITQSLDSLVQNGLLRKKGDDVYEFVTEAVRANVYAGLTETRRGILHRKAGMALEAKGHAGDSELARQFYLGRDNDRAVKYNVAAAQSATRAFAFDTAVTYLARALEAERRRPERDLRVEMRLLTEEGRLLTELGDLRRSEEVLDEAVRLTRSHPGHDLELGRALIGLAQSRYRRGEYPSAEVLATEAWSYLTVVGTMMDRMAVHRVLGVVYMRQGDLRRAEAHQRAALEIAEHEGSPIELGHALIDLANLMVPAGPVRLEPALELYARAANLFAEGGDDGARARVLMNRAVLEWMAGRTDDALKDLAPAIEAAERSRSPRWISYCYINLAQLQAELGHPELARPPLERAIQVSAPIGDGFADQQIVLTRGMIAHADRSFDTAEANYQESLNLAFKLHLPSEASEILLRMAQLSHDRGDDPRARARLAEARASGLLDHRPDFAPRVAALEQALSTPPNPER